MRRFLLLAHRVPVSGRFSLNDLAGGAGRMDEIARAVSTAFTLSNDLRRDTEVTVLFVAEPPPAARRIDLVGARLRYLNPDERSTAALLKNALSRSSGVDRTLEASPGLTVGPVAPDPALREFLERPGAVWLTEAGEPIERWDPGAGDVGALLSDPYDPSELEASIARASGVPRLSVGPRSLRASQVIDLVHGELDRRAPARPAPPRP
ncbi:MAG TPA: tRNA (pseudouridine(54)-N(1))-methyltransferase TrmY [Thermoplasmata archaeon]|nr:tRNA (pseudouridine(54)-N(1))-methyltransferase TrmY [Thermoplasmata archaeon]